MSNWLFGGEQNALSVISTIVTRLSKNHIIDLRQLMFKKDQNDLHHKCRLFDKLIPSPEIRDTVRFNQGFEDHRGLQRG